MNQFKVHICSNNVLVTKRLLNFIPNNGDTLRLAENEYYKVIEVCWCLDEPTADAQRVNIGTEPIEAKE